jgi:sugar lactone lactonase YvrE
MHLRSAVGVGFGVVTASVVALVLGACGSSSDDAAPTGDGGTLDEDNAPEVGPAEGGGPCPNAGLGSLTVTVIGLPASAAAKVDVQGAPVVKATSTIVLGGGVHSVGASLVTSADPVVRGVYTPTLSAASICVTNGGTASVTVTYEKVPASHSLWATHGNGDGQVASFAGDALGATGTTTGVGYDVGVPAAADVIFDKVGGMWISSGGGEVRHIPGKQLAAGGAKTADITLTSGDFQAGIPGPGSLALDAKGNLWVALIAQKKIVQVPAAGAAAGNATPSVVLEGDLFDGIGAMEFDKNGNLFVAATDRLLRFDAAHLTTSPAVPAVPDLTLETMSEPPLVNTLTTPSGLAFDATGNLWVAYFAAGLITKLTPAEIALAGDKTGASAITPGVQLKISAAANLEEIAFDESGGLWFTYATSQVARFAPAQLTASGEPTPATVVTATVVGSTKGLAFFPAPAALPLYSALP